MIIGFQAHAGRILRLVLAVPRDPATTTILLRARLFILKGQGIGNGIVSGRVTIVKSLFDMNKRARNKIVVVAGTDTEHIGLIEESAGLIVEEGGLSSHAAIACMSLGKPIIIGAADATELLPKTSKSRWM